MKINCKIFICSLLFLGTFSCIIASTIESEVEKARERESKSVIKCTPDGKDGGLTPMTALSRLKDGMTLLLMPGKYEADIEIFKNKIILQSEGKDYCNVKVKLLGRDCVVKNINLEKLISTRDIVVIDSLISSFFCGSWDSKSNEKIDVYIYNTGLRKFDSESSNNIIVGMKNCTINGEINCNSNLRLTIEDSILYSRKTLFRFFDHDSHKGRVVLKNNILFSQNKLGVVEFSDYSKKQGAVALTMKQLKRVWSVMPLGENIIKPLRFIRGNSFFLESSEMGEGKGLLADEHPFKPEKKSRPVKKVTHREKRADHRRLIPKKRPSENKKQQADSKTDEDDGFGGIPKPPE